MDNNAENTIDNTLNSTIDNTTGDTTNNPIDKTNSNAKGNAQDDPPLMQTQESLKIVHKLYEGINPLCDEPLPDNSFYLDNDIKRALQVALVALQRLQNYEVKQSKLPSNAGKPWTDEEDEQLIKAFRQDDNIHLLAQSHGRTKGSIKARLIKLGLLES